MGGDGRIRDDRGRKNGRGWERGRPSPWAGSAGLGDGPQLSARRRLRQRLGVDLSLAVETVHVLLVAACLVGLTVTFRRFFLLIGRRCLSPNCSNAVEDVHTVAVAVRFNRVYFLELRPGQ